MKLIFSLLLIATIIFAQNTTFEDNLNKAFANAKKGVYYAFSNIPERKNSFSKSLIEDDQLLSKVKLTKEVRGIKVESKGIYNTFEVDIVVYKSYDNLLQEGYIKYVPDDIN